MILPVRQRIPASSRSAGSASQGKKGRAERRAAPCCRVAVWRAVWNAVRRRVAVRNAVRRRVAVLPCGARRAAPCGGICRVGSAVRRYGSRWRAGTAG
eukprot:gene10289-biopygen6191